MATESSLSIGFAELKSQVGYYLGMGRGVDKAWSASQISEIEGIVQSGVRRVYYPPALSAQMAGYEWSWLRPAHTPFAITAGIWEYDLPDDFGRLVGTFHYPPAAYRFSITVIPVSKLTDMKSNADLTNDPSYVAIRYKEQVDPQVVGQRQEALFYPIPSTAWSLEYEYEAYSGALSDTFPYPLGGMQLAEVYIESCLALAETRINDDIGQHAQQFQALLVDAIARDRKRGAQSYGQMGHRERTVDPSFRRGYEGSVYPITYRGDTW